MKNVVATIGFIVWSSIASAGDISTASTYFGGIQGVGVGFWGHVGVGLPVGQTCHGSQTVVLLTSNPRYKEILTILIAAESTGQSVKMYQLGASNYAPAAGATYCVVTEAALGNFPIW